MKEQYIKINENGKFYYSDKKMKILHREDGPAVTIFNGYKSWFINGNLHREDGPAIEWRDGSKEYWINGKQYTEEEFNKITKKSLEFTLDEIADKFGVSVENLKIKK